jgi:transcriptional regulator with XRE-family HTH domain
MQTESPLDSQLDLEQALASRLKSLRLAQQLSLEDLAKRSGVSRASLARIEKCEVSPTANVLGKLCHAFGLTLSRLMIMTESKTTAVISRDSQRVWTDAQSGYKRRCVSPPSQDLSCEVLECELPPGTFIKYQTPPSPGLEHHLVLLEGDLQVTIEDNSYTLSPGDCLRYKLQGSSTFKVLSQHAVSYFLVVV